MDIDKKPNLVIDGDSYYVCEPTDLSDQEDVGENDLIIKYRYKVLR